MTEKDIYQEINKVQIQAIQLHSQFADMFDFMSLHGFKRIHESQFYSESKRNRKLHKYVINHKGILLIDNNIPYDLITPQELLLIRRDNFVVTDRRKYIESIFRAYVEKETETLAFYNKCASDLHALGCLVDSEKVLGYALEVDHELKLAARLNNKLKAIGFDMPEIMNMQQKIHDHYEKKC